VKSTTLSRSGVMVTWLKSMSQSHWEPATSAPKGISTNLTWLRPSRLAISLVTSTSNPPVSES
jgi:hypothetical protein